MWLSKQSAAREGNTGGTSAGRVTGVRGSMTVMGDGEYRDVAVYGPPGISALPLVGDNALLVEAGGEKRLLGVRNNTEGLEPGEIRLRSAGGAEILLKNNGEVRVNGQVIAGGEEEE